VNPSTGIFRRVLIAVSIVSSLVAIASCIGLAASFLKPSMGLFELYRTASLMRTAGFWFLGIYLISGFALLSAAPKSANLKVSSWESRGLKIICVICFLIIILSPYTYVYPNAGAWVTKSKAGTFSISNDVAAEYLWRTVRMWSAIPLCGSLFVISFVRDLVRRAPG